MKKIKIAIIAPSLVESGGVRSVVKFLVESLRNFPERYELDLISVATSFRDDQSKRLLSPKTWFRSIGVYKEQLWGLDLYQVGCNWSELEFQRYKPRRALNELVDQYDLAQLVCGLPVWGNIAKQWKVPMCMQVATLTSFERSAGSASGGPGLLSFWRKLMTNLTSNLDYKGIQYAKVVMYENELFKEWMDKNFPKITKTFAPPGIDVSIFSVDKVPSEQQSITGQRYILNVGRLNDPRKDSPTLVKAYSAYLKNVESEPYRLVIAGKNEPVPELLEEIKKNELEDRVKVLKDVSFPKLLQLYKDAEFFVLSSKEEGLGIVIMEAMAASLPVISTKCGGPNSLIDEGKTGFFVDIGDVNGLARKMCLLTNNAVLKIKMSRKAYETSRSFDNQKRIKPYIEVYDLLSHDF